jgi:hypothetical protein
MFGLLHVQVTPAGKPLTVAAVALVVVYPIAVIAAPHVIVWLVVVAAEVRVITGAGAGVAVMVVHALAVQPYSFCTVTHTVTLPDSGTYTV